MQLEHHWILLCIIQGRNVTECKGKVTCLQHSTATNSCSAALNTVKKQLTTVTKDPCRSVGQTVAVPVGVKCTGFLLVLLLPVYMQVSIRPSAAMALCGDGMLTRSTLSLTSASPSTRDNCSDSRRRSSPRSTQW